MDIPSEAVELDSTRVSYGTAKKICWLLIGAGCIKTSQVFTITIDFDMVCEGQEKEMLIEKTPTSPSFFQSKLPLQATVRWISK